MQEFRKFVKGPVGIALLVLFSIPFVATGFYGYFQGDSAGGQAVAEVNGVSIPRQKLQQTVTNLRERMRQQSPQLDPALLDSFINPAMVLQGMVNEELISQDAAELSMLYSTEQAAMQVRDVPEFQDETGRFSAEVMERFLRGRGMTPALLLQDIQHNALINQYRAAYHITGFSLPTELAEQRRLAEQERDFAYIELSLDRLTADQSVTQEQIQEWYEANLSEFMEPEKIKVEYVVASPSDYLDQIEVTDEQIRAEYQTRLQAFEMVAQQSQRRRAAHILIKQEGRTGQEVDQMIADIQARLDAGESFTDVARDVSEDLATSRDGGALGLLAPGDLPDSLDEVVFALEEGAVSGPVVSDAGTHLLRLDAIESRELPAFEELEASIRNDIVQQEAQVLLSEDTLNLEDLLFEHPDLEQPAEQTGLTVEATDWFALGAPTGIAALPEVREALASPSVQDGQNSELLETSDGRFVAVRIAERQPPAQQPLEQVRAEVEQALKRSQALALIDDRAEEARGLIETGEADLEALAASWSVSVENLEGIGRRAQVGSAELIDAAFSVARAAVNAGASPEILRLANGDLALLQVTAVRDGGQAPLTSSEESLALAELGSVEGQRTFREVLNALREVAELEVYEDRLGRQQDGLEGL